MPRELKQTWNAELYEGRHSFVWQLGQGVFDLLEPKKGENILDLGCGTGQLTHRISEAGATVAGLDSSTDMIGQARQNFPGITFILGDAAEMHFENEFDAVFSNAALHWMLDARAVVAGVARALKTGGRFVAEMGGKGNIAFIQNALQTVLRSYNGGKVPPFKNYYPSISEYSVILEDAGLEVRTAQLFDRPTPLEGEQGMANWLRQFCWYSFEALPAAARETALDEVVRQLREVLYRDGQWSADYRRLRFIAIKSK
jgi:trans-aconitate 2-methyltransferase